jgi:hypothetical protein
LNAALSAKEQYNTEKAAYEARTPEEIAAADAAAAAAAEQVSYCYILISTKYLHHSFSLRKVKLQLVRLRKLQKLRVPQQMLLPPPL